MCQNRKRLMNREIEVTIAIPVRDEEAYIENCLRSILASELDFDEVEILIIDGNSRDRTVEIIKQMQKHYPMIHLLHNPKSIIPEAMNIALKHARGRYFIRVDAHAEYPKTYFKKLLEWSRKLNADNVGGRCMTDVKNRNMKTESIKTVMSHPFGIGGGDYRGTIVHPISSHTVPFGCFKTDSLKKIGGFDHRLERTEDLDLNYRLRQSGGKVYLVPNVHFIYFAKESLRALARKSYNTGRWVVLSAYFTKRMNALRLYHFVPMIFVSMLIFPLLFCPLYSWGCIISSVTALVYTATIIGLSVRLKNRNNSFLYLILTFITLHTFYGIGSLNGIADIIIKSIARNYRNINDYSTK